MLKSATSRPIFSRCEWLVDTAAIGYGECKLGAVLSFTGSLAPVNVIRRRRTRISFTLIEPQHNNNNNNNVRQNEQQQHVDWQTTSCCSRRSKFNYMFQNKLKSAVACCFSLVGQKELRCCFGELRSASVIAAVGSTHKTSAAFRCQFDGVRAREREREREQVQTTTCLSCSRLLLLLPHCALLVCDWRAI